MELCLTCAKIYSQPVIFNGLFFKNYVFIYICIYFFYVERECEDAWSRERGKEKGRGNPKQSAFEPGAKCQA